MMKQEPTSCVIVTTIIMIALSTLNEYVIDRKYAVKNIGEKL